MSSRIEICSLPGIHGMLTKTLSLLFQGPDLLGFAFCKDSYSAVHPAGQITAQRFVSICNPLPWFTLTNRYLKFANKPQPPPPPSISKQKVLAQRGLDQCDILELLGKL